MTCPTLMTLQHTNHSHWGPYPTHMLTNTQHPTWILQKMLPHKEYVYILATS